MMMYRLHPTQVRLQRLVCSTGSNHVTHPSRRLERKIYQRLLATSVEQQPQFHWLDLRGSGLSALERLGLEEALLRHDKQERCWAIVGTHDPLNHLYLEQTHPNHSPSCIVVMGVGGKPRELLNIPLVQRDAIPILKRFSGGGTVVLDKTSLWVTFIGRNKQMNVQPYPRQMMEWTGNAIYSNVFRTLGEKQKHKNDTGNNLIPTFALRENDYVLGERKMGGNAQSIVKDGWLHHTSFLWDYSMDNMQYLCLPKKRPEYRGDRSHDDFLIKLRHVYPSLKPSDIFDAIRNVCLQEFPSSVKNISLNEAMSVVEDKFGSLQEFWESGKCRTKLVAGT